MCFIEGCLFDQVCQTINTEGVSGQNNLGFLEKLQKLVRVRDAAIMGLACMRVYDDKCGLSAFNPNSFKPTLIVLEDLSSPDFSDRTFWSEVDEYEQHLRASS